ncbi:MAG: GNAT family N-acetyltransferase [Bryobacteraceae bacterium]
MIRNAAPADAGAIARVHRRAVEQLCAGHYPPEQIRAWAVPRGLPPFEEVLARTLVLVYEREGAVAGFGQLDPEAAEIISLFVDPDRAGKGIGTALLAALEDAARRSGLKRLRLNSSLNAAGFYESRGYRREGPCTQLLPDGVTRVECIRMSKGL